MIRLFGTYTSPYVRHCRIALAESGIDYEFVPTDYERSAQLAPAKRVPFLHDGDRVLNDSLSILKYVRESAGQAFLPELDDADLFALANTGLDTAINLFLLEKDGLGPDDSPYLARQAARVEAVLDALASRARALSESTPGFGDGALRLGCFLDWARFRRRFTLDAHPPLASTLERLEDYKPFADTPPRES